jgi:hypothetical protein
MSIENHWIINVQIWDEEGTQFGELRYGSCLEDSVFVRKLSEFEIQDYFRLGKRAFLSRMNSHGVYVPN